MAAVTCDAVLEWPPSLCDLDAGHDGEHRTLTLPAPLMLMADELADRVALSVAGLDRARRRLTVAGVGLLGATVLNVGIAAWALVFG